MTLARPAAMVAAIVAAGSVAVAMPSGQDTAAIARLRAAPGFERYETLTREIVSGRLAFDYAPTWTDDSRSFTYTHQGRRWRFDVATRSSVPLDARAAAQSAPPRPWRVDTRGATDVGDRTRWLSDDARAAIVDVDEQAGIVYYMARDGDNFLKPQLHRARPDGTGDTRLTDPALRHDAVLSPDCRYFVDIAQAHDRVPMLLLKGARDGRTLADVAHADLGTVERLGLKRSEMFSYLAADGVTRLFGRVEFPSTFNPSTLYPVLVRVYGAPESTAQAVDERFSIPAADTELGFLVVTLSSRALPGVGRQAMEGIRGALGRADVDDFANGIRALRERSYVDGNAVGVSGTSYGGYVAAMLLLRYPELVAAASASSPLVVWDDYDPAYAERYMGRPQENPDGYRDGSLLTYAARLRGSLQIYYGTADGNVPPRHAQRLIEAIRAANPHADVEVVVGNGAGHTSVSHVRLLAFFLDRLVSHAG